jgi:hypothetical protein
MNTLIGSLVWLGILVYLRPSIFEGEWSVAMFLLAPLVLLSFALPLAFQSREASFRTRLQQIALRLQLPAALLLSGSFLLPAGIWAGLLSLPWLILTALVALVGLGNLSRGTWKQPEELCLSMGQMYLVIGGAWAAASRTGIRPLDFDPVIVLLTAIHFHYAGFLLPLMTGLAGRILDGTTARLAAWGVVAGVPSVAAGITATQLGMGHFIECTAAWITALAGVLTAWLHLRLAMQVHWPRQVRILWGLVALSLLFSMGLAALYGSRAYFPLDWLDIPWMRALHGTANAFGFGLAGVYAWSLAYRRKRISA